MSKVKRKYIRYATTDKKKLITKKNQYDLSRFLKAGRITRPESEATFKMYESALNIWFVWLAEFHDNPDVLDIDWIEDDFADVMLEYTDFVRNYLGNGKKATNLKLSAISSFYIFYTKRRKIPYNPMDTGLVERMRGSKDEKRIDEHFLTEEQVIQIQEELERVMKPNYDGPYDQMDRVLFNIAYVSAARVGALSRLTVDSWDEEAMVFSNIREKGNKIVNIPVDNKVKEMIKDYLAYRKRLKVDTESFFYVWYDRAWQGMSSASLHARITKIGHIIGIDNLRPHSIRKTRANIITKKYGNLELAQTLLNHADISTTQAFYTEKEDGADVLARIAELEKMHRESE